MKWSTASILSIAVIAQAAEVHFSLDLTWAVGSPNGFEREMIFVNGQFPGPPLVVDEGDDLVIDVTNHLPFNTSIHYHGIEQLGTPWADGVSGLSQWAIQPGQSYTYKWRADTYGTYWYHAHDKAAIMDGLYGAIYIRPSPDRETPFALISSDSSDIEAMKRADREGQLAVLSDWDHLTSEEYMDALKETGYDIFCTDSILVNGHGSVFCNDPEILTQMLPEPVAKVVNGTLTDKGCLPFARSLQGDWEHHPEKLPAGLNDGCKPSITQDAMFTVDADDQWASFHIVGAANLKVLVVSIDEHPMWVYEVDGRYIEPQLAHSMTIYNGERYSIMIKLDKEPANYKLRVANSAGSQVVSGFGTISYRGGELSLRSSEPYIDYASANMTADVVVLNPDNLPPFPAITPAEVADDFHLLTLRRINSSWQWSLDGTTFLPNNLGVMTPAILDPAAPELASALKISTRNNTWVDIIFQLQVQELTPVQPPHAMHKHSNKAFLLGNGLGKFQWGSIEEAKKATPESFLKTPIYRDTFVTSPRGEAWTAIRYHVVNPGPFLLHCHMETHLASGMGLVLMDGVDAWPTVNAEQITPF